MLTSGPLHGHSRELYNVFWLLCTRAGLCCALRSFLGVYLSILGGSGSTHGITRHYSSYGNHLLPGTCRIRCNEKYICGQGNNRALNYRQHTSNQLTVQVYGGGGGGGGGGPSLLSAVHHLI